MTLNEGRGQNPGDTIRLSDDIIGQEHRSTKAGAKTPATPEISFGDHLTGHTLNEGRGQNPGDTGCPTQTDRPGRPLNEGRGQNPGDTPTE